MKQIKGEYQIKSKSLYSLFHTSCEIKDTLTEFNIQHVPRESNKHADRLSNEGVKKFYRIEKFQTDPFLLWRKPLGPTPEFQTETENQIDQANNDIKTQLEAQLVTQPAIQPQETEFLRKRSLLDAQQMDSAELEPTKQTIAETLEVKPAEKIKEEQPSATLDEAPKAPAAQSPEAAPAPKKPRKPRTKKSVEESAASSEEKPKKRNPSSSKQKPVKGSLKSEQS